MTDRPPGEAPSADDEGVRRRAEALFQRLLDESDEPADSTVHAVARRAPGEVRDAFLAIVRDYRFLRGRSGDAVAGLAPGREIGEYRLRREIGRGSMGAVWEAEQGRLDRRVALKVLHPHLTLAPRAVERFEREASAVGRLSHPNVVAVHGVGEHDGFHVIAQELVRDGRTLADWIEERRRARSLPRDHDRDVARIFAALADGLQAAHLAGVVHRDLKPANVLLDAEDRPRLADFGLARLGEEQGLTRTGELLGTAAYLSPEMAAGATVGPASDVFALGVCLYEALTLSRPFRGDTAGHLARQIVEDEPPHPCSRRSRLSRELACVVLRALEKDPRRRYPSASELAEDLTRWSRDEPVRARPQSAWRRCSKWVRRHPGGAAAVGAVAAVIVLLSLLLLQSRALRKRAELAAESTETLLLLLDPAYVGTDRVEALAALEADLRSNDDLDPPRRADLSRLVGRLFRQLGAPMRAVPVLREALGIQLAELGEDDPGTLATRMELGRAFADAWRTEEAAGQFGSVLAGVARGAGAADLELDALVARYLVLSRAERFEDLARLAGEHVGLEARLREAVERADVQPRRALLGTALARLLLDRGAHAEALDEARRSEADLAAHLGTEHPATLEAAVVTATALYELDRDAESRAVYRAVDERATRTLGRLHPRAVLARRYAARAAVELDRLDQAGRELSAVLPELTAVFGADDPRTLDAIQLYAVLLNRLELWDGAERVFSALLPRMERVLGADHSTTLICKRGLVEVMLAEERWDEAEHVVRDQLARHLAVRDWDDDEVLQTLQYLAWIDRRRGRHGSAAETSRLVVEIRRRNPADPHRLREACIDLARCLALAGETEEARCLLDESDPALWPDRAPRDEAAREHLATQHAMARADLCLASGEPDRAEEWLDRAGELNARRSSCFVQGAIAFGRARAALARSEEAAAARLLREAIEVLPSFSAELPAARRLLRRLAPASGS